VRMNAMEIRPDRRCVVQRVFAFMNPLCRKMNVESARATLDAAQPPDDSV